MDLIWKTSLCSGVEMHRSCLWCMVCAGIQNGHCSCCSSFPIPGCKPQPFRACKSLFKLAPVVERESYAKSIRDLCTYIQHCLFLGYYMFKYLRIFSSSNSLSVVVSSKSNFWTLLFEQSSGLKYIYEGKFSCFPRFINVFMN